MNFIKHFKNSERHYGWISITLHWLIGLCIIGLYFLGGYMMDISYYDSFYTLGPKIHEALGISVLLLMVFRVLWTLFNTKPNPAANNSNFVNKASSIAHIGLYCMTFVILISGLLVAFAGGHGLEIFDWFTIPGPNQLFDNQASRAGEIHELVGNGLMALVVLHALAALKHHFFEKDNTLSKMLGIKEK